MPKKEISWKRRSETGERVEVYVRHVKEDWIFYAREGRHERWRLVEVPPLEDWLALLNAVSRRTARQFLRSDEEARLKKMILDRFPDANLD